METALDPQFGEGSANDAMAIEFPNTSWLQRNVAGGDKFKLVNETKIVAVPRA